MLLHGLFVSAVAFAGQPKQAEPRTNGVLILDGAETRVHWDDGDTFSVPERKLKARLMGYNTLESYGAVHRFGPGEKRLFEIAEEATTLARSQAWTCTSYNTEGGYGRKNVDCPDLRRALLEAGLAHVFSVNGPADEADLKAQAIGIKAAVGMWSEGPPSSLVTSIHSLDEKPGAESTYNRVLDLETGEASKRPHSNTHAVCEWVCVDDSCLLYVPYKQRYGEERAECLK